MGYLSLFMTKVNPDISYCARTRKEERNVHNQESEHRFINVTLMKHDRVLNIVSIKVSMIIVSLLSAV